MDAMLAYQELEDVGLPIPELDPEFAKEMRDLVAYDREQGHGGFRGVEETLETPEGSGEKGSASNDA